MSERAFRNPYPDYDVLAKWDTPSWNTQTRAVLRERLTNVPPRRFLTEAQYATLETVCDRVMPQNKHNNNKKAQKKANTEKRKHHNNHKHDSDRHEHERIVEGAAEMQHPHLRGRDQEARRDRPGKSGRDLALRGGSSVPGTRDARRR